jgi:nucleoid-associated protein YgaU
MGLLDNLFDKDDDKEKKKKADFSGVAAGGSTTAPKPVEAPPASRVTSDVERTYTVVAGDTLSEIAKREYGDASKWKRIYEANKDTIKNPDLIYPGQTFKIPDA